MLISNLLIDFVYRLIRKWYKKTDCRYRNGFDSPSLYMKDLIYNYDRLTAVANAPTQ